MTTQARFQWSSQLHQKRAQAESQPGTQFCDQYCDSWDEYIRLAYGRTPFSLACSWGRRISLENVERGTTSPRAPISRLGEGYKLHVSCVSSFKDGRLRAIAVIICPKGKYAPSAVVSTEKYLMFADVTIAPTILAWYVCNAVDQISLTHIYGQRMR